MNLTPVAAQEILNPICKLATRRLVILVCVLICGCAAAKYGSLSRSQDVTRSFEAFQVVGDHRYDYLDGKLSDIVSWLEATPTGKRC